jgi:hypothetical protein
MINEEKLNLSIRKFLKGVGINSQRIIENKIREIVDSGKNENLSNVSVSINIKSQKLDINEEIKGQIEVEFLK